MLKVEYQYKLKYQSSLNYSIKKKKKTYLNVYSEFKHYCFVIYIELSEWYLNSKLNCIIYSQNINSKLKL